ncbi:MAG: hypothetical protein KC635_14715, partial [Myxococcales bacterium]|nr:hypothetical protein [Myxococcales bacterium]
MNRALPDELARFDDAAVAAVLRGFDVARRWHRYEVRGLERVPEGPAILVGNHNGGVSAIDG